MGELFFLMTITTMRSFHQRLLLPAKRYFCSSSGWFDTKLVEIGKMTHDTVLLTFELPDDKKHLTVPFGHSFFVKPARTSEVETAKRSYTPLLQERDDGTVRLAVKVYSDGPLTQHLDSLKVGNHVQMKGPKGRMTDDSLFYGDPKKPKTLCMVAGGSGITPFLQVLRYYYNFIKLYIIY